MKSLMLFTYPFEWKFVSACGDLSQRFTGSELQPFTIFFDGLGKVIRLEFKIPCHEISVISQCSCLPQKVDRDICQESFLVYDPIDDPEIAYLRVEWSRLKQKTVERLFTPLKFEEDDFAAFSLQSERHRKLVESSFPNTWKIG